MAQIDEVDPPEPVGPASTQYSRLSGWQGTSAAEAVDANTNFGKWLLQAGENPSDWRVVGFSIYSERHDTPSISLYAIRLSDLKDGSLPDIAASNDGAVPVVRFRLPRGTSIGELIAESLTRVKIVAASSDTSGTPFELVVTEEAHSD